MTFLDATTLAYKMNITSNTYPCYIMIYMFNSPTTFVFLFNTKFLDNTLRGSSLSGCLIAFHTSVTWIAWSQWGSVKAYSNWSRAASTVCLRMFQLQTYARQHRVLPHSVKHSCLDFFIRWKYASIFQNCRIASRLGRGLVLFSFCFPFGTHH